MESRGGVDQLRVDPSPATRLLNTAFEDVTHAEFATDVLDVDRPALVGERRVPRDHEQTGELGKAGGQLVRHAIAEVALLRIAAQVVKGQDGDRGLVRQRRRGLLGKRALLKHRLQVEAPPGDPGRDQQYQAARQGGQPQAARFGSPGGTGSFRVDANAVDAHRLGDVLEPAL